MHTEQLKVTGMSCDGCVSSVTKALKAVDCIDDVSVPLGAGESAISYGEHLKSRPILRPAIVAAGYGSKEQTGALKGGCCG